jgi:hypothetical protein
MRSLRVLILALALPGPAVAGGYGSVYLVPALAECPGPASCSRAFESAYTFDTIILHSRASRYLDDKKPSFLIDVRGVRDPSGALVNGTVTVRILSGRVSVPGIGTFPDSSPLTRVAPFPIPLKNGGAKRFPYRSPAAPNGTITNGGGVDILDPEGKRLAVTGSQAKP